MENIEEDKVLEINQKDTPIKPVIKHIVVSGGGTAGYTFYGAIREAHKQNKWKMEHIETLHGISVGSILITLLCLEYDWEDLDDFLIKRPWHQLFKFNVLSITSSFQNKGVFSIDVIKNLFLPLFKGKDLSIDITLKEFYEFSKKEIHIYATELHSYKLIDFSYKTHPDWKIIDVIYSSCSIPGIFMPLIVNEECYCDGGIICNYPLKLCLNNGIDPQAILGINIQVNTSKRIIINKESSIFDYIICILNKLLFRRVFYEDKNNIVKIPNEITVSFPQFSIYGAYEILSSQDLRMELVEEGKKIVEKMVMDENL